MRHVEGFLKKVKVKLAIMDLFISTLQPIQKMWVHNMNIYLILYELHIKQ